VAGALDEDLLGDLRVAVLADVARLGREDDRRIALHRQNDVRVAMDDLEAGEVRDRALEAGVLRAADERGVEAVPLERGAHTRVPRSYLCVQLASVPLMSAQIASLSGVGTPCSWPKRTMPPLRKSTSVGRRASTSCSIDALWSYATSGFAAWSIRSSGSASSTMPCAAATALPSSTIPVTSARRSGRSHTRPCVSPVSAPIGFVDALKITFRHCGPRASSTACAGIPPRVHASA